MNKDNLSLKKCLEECQQWGVPVEESFLSLNSLIFSFVARLFFDSSKKGAYPLDFPPFFSCLSTWLNLTYLNFNLIEVPLVFWVFLRFLNYFQCQNNISIKLIIHVGTILGLQLLESIRNKIAQAQTPIQRLTNNVWNEILMLSLLCLLLFFLHWFTQIWDNLYLSLN